LVYLFNYQDDARSSKLKMFMVVCRWILRKMRTILDKSCKKNENIFFFVFENLDFYEIMWKNIVELDRPRMVLWITEARIRTLTQDISPATMVTRTRLSVTLYQQFLSFYWFYMTSGFPLVCCNV